MAEPINACFIWSVLFPSEGTPGTLSSLLSSLLSSSLCFYWENFHLSSHVSTRLQAALGSMTSTRPSGVTLTTDNKALLMTVSVSM